MPKAGLRTGSTATPLRRMTGAAPFDPSHLGAKATLDRVRRRKTRLDLISKVASPDPQAQRGPRGVGLQ
jgi:hypothetical protein